VVDSFIMVLCKEIVEERDDGDAMRCATKKSKGRKWIFGMLSNTDELSVCLLQKKNGDGKK